VYADQGDDIMNSCKWRCSH